MASVLSRTPVTFHWSGAAQTKQITIPASYQVGDTMLLFAVGGQAFGATPSGWLTVSSGTYGSGLAEYWVLLEKVATAGDVTGSTVLTFTSSAAKGDIILWGRYTTAGSVSLLNNVALGETALTGVHALGATSVPGTAAVDSILVVKDTISSVSGSYTPPTGLTLTAQDTSGGGNQVAVALAQSTSDVPAGTFGSGLSWSVFQSDGVTPATSSDAGVLNVVTCAVVRPTADITVPSGTTFTGGTTMWGVLSDDDPTTYFDVTGTGTWEVRIPIAGGLIPESVFLAWIENASPSSRSVQASLYLGTTKLLDLAAADTTAHATRYQAVWSTSALTSSQISAILADPTNLRLRVTFSVA